MLISRDQRIAGMPAVEARELMRDIRECAASTAYVAERLDRSLTEATSILEQLALEGFVEPVEARMRAGLLRGADEIGRPASMTEGDWWGTTVAGNALSKARIGKRMPRAKATELLDGLIERVVELNGDPDGAFTVESVSVFGSYADRDRDEVGDVDVSVIFRRRLDGDEYMARCLAAADEAESTGHRFSTYHDRLSHLEMTFRRRIRGRSPRLDVQFTQAGGDPRLPPGVTLRQVYDVSS